MLTDINKLRIEANTQLTGYDTVNGWWHTGNDAYIPLTEANRPQKEANTMLTDMDALRTEANTQLTQAKTLSIVGGTLLTMLTYC